MEIDITAANRDFLQAAIACGWRREQSQVVNEALTLLKGRFDFEQSLDLASRELDAGLGIPAETVFDRLEKVAKQLDQQAHDSVSQRRQIL